MDRQDAPDLGPNAVPDRIIIDGKGYGWRVWDWDLCLRIDAVLSDEGDTSE